MSNRGGLRHGVLAAAAVIVVVVAAITACSSDTPPANGNDATSGGPTSRDGGTATTSDATVIGTTSSSASSSSSGGLHVGDDDDDGGDAGPACLGDTLTGDGGDPQALCPTSGPCASGCTFIVQNYRPGVAQSAAACMAKQGASCSDPNICLSAASHGACPRADADSFCTPLVKPCDPNADTDHGRMTTAACTELANALTTTARTAFGACMMQGINDHTCPDKGVQCILDDEP